TGPTGFDSSLPRTPSAIRDERWNFRARPDSARPFCTTGPDTRTAQSARLDGRPAAQFLLQAEWRLLCRERSRGDCRVEYVSGTRREAGAGRAVRPAPRL